MTNTAHGPTRDDKMRRTYRCQHGHVTLSAVELTAGRCFACWPDLDWPDSAPLDTYTEMEA